MQILQAMHSNPHNKSPGGAPGTPVRSNRGAVGLQRGCPACPRAAGSQSECPIATHSNPGWGPLVDQNQNTALQHSFFLFSSPKRKPACSYQRHLFEDLSANHFSPALQTQLADNGVWTTKPSLITEQVVFSSLSIANKTQNAEVASHSA